VTAARSLQEGAGRSALLTRPPVRVLMCGRSERPVAAPALPKFGTSPPVPAVNGVDLAWSDEFAVFSRVSCRRLPQAARDHEVARSRQVFQFFARRLVVTAEKDYSRITTRRGKIHLLEDAGWKRRPSQNRCIDQKGLAILPRSVFARPLSPGSIPCGCPGPEHERPPRRLGGPAGG